MNGLQETYIKTWLELQDTKVRTKTTPVTLESIFLGRVPEENEVINKHKLIVVGFLAEENKDNYRIMTCVKAFFDNEFESIKNNFEDGKEYYFLTSQCSLYDLIGIEKKLNNPCEKCKAKTCNKCIHAY